MKPWPLQIVACTIGCATLTNGIRSMQALKSLFTSGNHDKYRNTGNNAQMIRTIWNQVQYRFHGAAPKIRYSSYTSK